MSDWSKIWPCPECGVGNPVDGEFCVNCRTELKAAIAREQAAREERLSRIWKNRRRADKAICSILRIGDDQYEIEDVAIAVHHLAEPGHDDRLEVNIFADTRGMSQAGFVINSLFLRGLRGVEDLCGKAFLLNRVSDCHDELAESVICQPGKVLEIDSLRLKFGRLEDGLLAVKMEVVCHGEGKSAIAVKVDFMAVVQ